MSSSAPQVPQVQVNFALQIGGGQMQVTAQVPEGRVNLVQLLPVIKQISSNIVNAVAGLVEQSGRQISCKAGCGACCRQMVPVSLFEMEELAGWIQTLPPEQQAILENRFQTALASLKASGILDRLNLKELPGQSAGKDRELALDYLQVGVPCPFLENESCSIHPIRPLICREYLVTSPPEYCAHPTPETVRAVPRPVKLSRAMYALGAEVTAEKQGWMPLVFLFAWIRSGMSVAHAYEAPGPDLLRMVMERITVSGDAPESRLG